MVPVDPKLYPELTISAWEIGQLSIYQAVSILFNVGFRGRDLDLKAKYAK